MATPLEGFLSYYQSLGEPGFAVLVTGAWGVGKTFQVKQCLAEDQRYYVSLFGVQTVDQLHAEVFAVAAPRIANTQKFVGAASETVSSLGGLFSLAGAAPGVMNALLRKDLKPERTLVFDDLERSELKLKDILGAINYYVEQKGFRVIVIAHDEKLADAFGAMKEKLFGQTIRVEPQVESAFDGFVAKLSSARSRDFIERHRSDLIEEFAAYKDGSLRILRHSIEDLARLVEALEDRHIAHKEAMSALVRFFVRRDFDWRSSGEPPVAGGKKSTDRHHILGLSVLRAMFTEGRYDPSEIRASIDGSAYFVRPEEDPPWKILHNFEELDQSIVQTAIDAIDRQIGARQLLDIGEMLHVFALRLSLADLGAMDHDLEVELENCIAYIDDILETGDLTSNWRPDSGSYELEESMRNNAVGGAEFWLTENAKDSFDSLKKHLENARHDVFIRFHLERLVDEVLRLIAEDANFFGTVLGSTKSGLLPGLSGGLFGKPFLNAIDPVRFVETWLGAPVANQRLVSVALVERYKEGQLTFMLGDEYDWCRLVCHEMHSRADAQSGLEAVRVRRLIPPFFETLSAQSETDGGDG